MLILDPASGPVVDETVIKKSRFIATAIGIRSTEEFAEFLAGVTAAEPGARHVCWAYTVGSGSSLVARSSDDGEPGGTAGPPILAALQSREVANAAITVVRYFGGVKLGAGGLIRAYGGSANAVLDQAPLRAAVATAVLTVDAPIDAAGRLEGVLHALGSVLSVEYTAAGVRLVVEVPARDEVLVGDRILSLTSGAAAVVDIAHRLA